MKEQIIVQYVGFAVKALAREYTFAVREPASEPREYTLAITNEAFESHRARYQDAPEICSLKLHRELASNTNHSLATRLSITDSELADYQSAHKQKSQRSYTRNRED